VRKSESEEMRGEEKLESMKTKEIRSGKEEGAKDGGNKGDEATEMMKARGNKPEGNQSEKRKIKHDTKRNERHRKQRRVPTQQRKM
jgi:hypothetical protein